RFARGLDGFDEGFQASVVTGEQSRGRFAYLTNAERVDEAVERDATPPLDRLQELGGRLLAPPLTHDQVSLALVQPEDVAGSADQAVLPESGDVLAAEAFDVERLPGDEVAQPLDRLRRADQPPRAAAHDVLLPGRGIDRARRQ